MSTKRLLFVLCMLLVPAGMFLAAWQSYTFYLVDRDVSRLEREQQELIESNKRLIARFAAETSPRIIEQRAFKELEMAWPRQDQVIKLIVRGKDSDSRDPDAGRMAEGEGL